MIRSGGMKTMPCPKCGEKKIIGIESKLKGKLRCFGCGWFKVWGNWDKGGK